MSTKFIAAALAAAGVLALPAFAGTMTAATPQKKATTAHRMIAPDAQLHFKEIASADLAKIMTQYAPNATLEWIGGPLDGTYSGKDQIQAVWKKYVAAMGKTGERSRNILVSMNPKGMTVTANVEFKGKHAVPVRYVLVYRDKKIIDEIWQVKAKPHATM